MNQSGSRTISFEEARNNDRYSSHSDIVVECGSDAFKTIGGNVGNDTVGEKIFVWRDPKLVRSDNKEQQVFAVLRPPVN